MSGVPGGALAGILLGAVNSLRHAVDSTSGAAEHPGSLLTLAERVRRALAGLAIAPNEPVHVVIGNRPSDLGALLGVWQAGAVAVPIHVSAAASTVERVQRTSRARFSIDGDRIDAFGQPPPPDRALLADAALVIFTSGSTGEPKGVVVGHRRLADKLAVLDSLLKFGSHDVVLLPLQLTFIFGLWVSLLALMKGARLVLVPKFTAEAMKSGLTEASVLGGVPTMFRTLLSNPAVAAPKLRSVLSGGEVLSPALARTIARLAPVEIYDLYGLTETGSCDFCLGPADQPQGFGTIGRPTEGVAFRLARDGRIVAAGEAGELQIRTPFGMSGYLDNPQLTAASFDGGYFQDRRSRAADRGGICRTRRPRQRHYLARRQQDRASRDRQSPGRASRHRRGALRRRAGRAARRSRSRRHRPARRRPISTPRRLRDWLIARTERFKVPDVFHIRDALPSGSSGKADRRAVAQLAASAADRR